MSLCKKESKFENRIKKSIIPITITTNTNPSNYVFVNKTNQLASLYIKMGQKIQSKKHKVIKSCSNIQYSDDSPKNNLTDNSLNLPNYSMIKNLKTKNSSGYNTNRAQDNEQKKINKGDYLIHVNLNRNHTSNFALSTKNNNNKNKRIKFSDKNIISSNNAELYSSIYNLSTRNKGFHQNEKENIEMNLKKMKNNMKKKKFRIPFNERKKNRYISTSFCSVNTQNIHKTMQKSENKYISNNSSKNKIISGTKNEKRNQHNKYNTMILDENNFNGTVINNNNIVKQRIQKNNKNLINFKNNSVLSLTKDGIKDKLEDITFNLKRGGKSNCHIKNNLSTNNDKISINYPQLLTKEKYDINNSNKENINNNQKDKKPKKKKGKNLLIERKVNLTKKEFIQEIKNKIDAKKNILIKNPKKKTKKNKKIEKIQEFSKIIVLNEYKNKKTSVNFYNKFNNNSKKIFSNRTKRDNFKTKKINFILNNSKSREGNQLIKIDSFKPKTVKNNSIINYSIDNKLYNNYLSDNSKKENNLIDISNKLNSTCYPFPLMNNKANNYKKPIIKIISKNNASFNNNHIETKNYNSVNNNNVDKKNSNSLVINNSEIISLRQNDLLKDKNLIIKKKKKIANNSFHINKRLMSFSSRTGNIINNNIEIKNSLFFDDNLLALPEDYDSKYDDLYSVVRKINFGSVLIGAESYFSIDSQKYKDYQYNFDIAFNNKFNKTNIYLDENKGKYIKKINNSFSSKTDFSSSNKNFHTFYNNNSVVPNEFEISELI